MAGNALMVRIYKKHTFDCNEQICMSCNNGHAASIFLLSYYDGMCVNEIEDMNDYINDEFCNQHCREHESEKHLDIRKLLLYKPSSTVDLGFFNGEKPLLAFIGVKIVFCPEEADVVKMIRSTLVDTEQTVSQLFWSLGIDDYYICIATNDWNDVNNILHSLRDKAHKEKIMLQTNTILGFHSCLISSHEKYAKILKEEYSFRTMAKLKYSVQLNNICDTLSTELKDYGINADVVELAMGIYDMEITFHTCLERFVRLIADNGALGTHSPYVEYSSTSVQFGRPKGIDMECKDTFIDSDQYQTLVDSMASGFIQCDSMRSLLNKTELDERIVFSFINSYTSCFKQLYSFPCFIDFCQIGEALQTYKTILTDMINRLEKLKDKNPEQFRVSCREIEESLRSITSDLMTLADDRLSTDFPISDRVDNNIYEKGAYERLIKAWSNYIDRVKSICGARENTFLIIPQLSCSTVTNVHFPNSSDTRKFITVNLSISDIIKFQHLMIVLAHEVGHYCTGDKYISDTLMRLYILFAVNITVDGLLRSLSSEQQLSYDDWTHEIGMSLSNSICNVVISRINNDFASYDKCNDVINDVFDTIRTTIRTNKMQITSKIDGYADIMMYCSRILRHFAIFETDVFSPTVFTNIFESTLKASSAFSKYIINETNADIFMMARLGIDITTYERNFREEYRFEIDKLKEAIPDNVFLQPQEVLFLRILCVICAVSSNNIIEEFYLLKVYNYIQQQDADNVVNAVDLLSSTALKGEYTNGTRNNSFLAFISALTSKILIPELRELYDYYISKQDMLFSGESRDFFFGSQSNSSIRSMMYFMKMFSHKSV